MIKRTLAQNRAYKTMLKKLDNMLGEIDAPMLIAILLDCLERLVDGVDEREMRTIEIKLNGFFTEGYDFVNRKAIR